MFTLCKGCVSYKTVDYYTVDGLFVFVTKFEKVKVDTSTIGLCVGVLWCLSYHMSNHRDRNPTCFQVSGYKSI